MSYKEIKKFIHRDVKKGGEGFGEVSTSVIFDKQTSVEAKAVFAYLCSFTCRGSTTVPGVTTMAQELVLPIEKIYDGIAELKKAEYLDVSSSDTRRVYTLSTTLSGGGLVPCTLMRDKAIPCKAKVVYAAVSCMIGHTPMRPVETTYIPDCLGISEKCLQSALDLLVEREYISFYELQVSQDCENMYRKLLSFNHIEREK